MSADITYNIIILCIIYSIHNIIYWSITDQFCSSFKYYLDLQATTRYSMETLLLKMLLVYLKFTLLWRFKKDDSVVTHRATTHDPYQIIFFPSYNFATILWSCIIFDVCCFSGIKLFFYETLIYKFCSEWGT